MKLDRQGLYLDVLGIVNPRLADTLEMERRMSGDAIEVVAVVAPEGAENDEALDSMVPPGPGKIVLKDPEDAAALIAAERVCANLDKMWSLAKEGKGLSKHKLFLAVLGHINPDLLRTLLLEAELNGEGVIIEMSEAGDGEQVPMSEAFGVVNLDQDAPDGASAVYAASVADDLYELLDRNTVKAAPRWYERFRRS